MQLRQSDLPLVDSDLEGIGPETLYSIIGAIARGPDLDQILAAVVELLSDATECHACFIYLLEGQTLRMRAASRIHSHLVGRIELGVDEGLCGWVVRNREPAFIKEQAVDDPRMKIFPELEEERFQSMIAVPLVLNQEEVVGVVVLHTEAPREFGADVADFMVHVASLIAGTIHNAYLFDETRRGAGRLSSLVSLGHRIAAEASRNDLYSVSCEGVVELLEASAARLLLIDETDQRVDVVATAGRHDWVAGPQKLLPSGSVTRELRARLVSGSEELGALVVARPEPFDDEDARLLQAVTNQLALALQKVELIERLTGENVISDMFDALLTGQVSVAESRALAAHHDLSYPQVIAMIVPIHQPADEFAKIAEPIATRLRRLVPGALVDIGDEGIRALLPITGEKTRRLARIDEELRMIGTESAVAIGRSQSRRGLTEGGRSLAEAKHSARVARGLERHGGCALYEDLGVYRYLEREAGGPVPDERHADAIETLRAYDRQRRGALTQTLERFLESRGGIAATAREMFIHPNTLRQRIERIEALTDLCLDEEDLLSLELALKVAHLRDPLPPV